MRRQVRIPGLRRMRGGGVRQAALSWVDKSVLTGQPDIEEDGVWGELRWEIYPYPALLVHSEAHDCMHGNKGKSCKSCFLVCTSFDGSSVYILMLCRSIS